MSYSLKHKKLYELALIEETTTTEAEGTINHSEQYSEQESKQEQTKNIPTYGGIIMNQKQYEQYLISHHSIFSQTEESIKHYS